jgi:hypothetical protein
MTETHHTINNTTTVAMCDVREVKSLCLIKHHANKTYGGMEV